MRWNGDRAREGKGSSGGEEGQPKESRSVSAMRKSVTLYIN